MIIILYFIIGIPLIMSNIINIVYPKVCTRSVVIDLLCRTYNVIDIIY